MREIRIIVAITVILVAAVVGGFLWGAFSPDSDNMDKMAVAHIVKLCNERVDCKLQAGDLFDGDWDTLYVIGSQVSQDAINDTLHTHRIRARDGNRTVVLTSRNKVVESQHLPYGLQTPLDGELEFEQESHREQRIDRYDRDDWLEITVYPNHARSASFYVLTAKLPALK